MRHVFISLFVAAAVAMMGIGIIAPILPLYAKTFSASGVSIGLVFAAFSLSRVILGPLLGRLSDRIGRKRMLLLGLGGFAVVSLLYVIAMSLWQLGVFRLLQGAASVMVTPIAQAYVGDITPPGREGRSMNLFYSAIFLGMALGPLIGGGMVELWSYEAAFYAMGVMSLVALLLVARTVPADRRRRTHRVAAGQEIVSLRHVARNDAVKGILVYVATRGFWRQGFNTFFPIFAASTGSLGEATIGWVLSLYMLGGGLLQIPFGFLADRWPRFPQILLGSVLAPLLLLFVPLLREAWAISALMFAVGAFSALSRASVIAIRTAVGRTHGMGTLAGLQGSGFAAGQMIGPLACGIVADLAGVAAVFPFASAVGLAGSGLVALWFRKWLLDAQRKASTKPA
jgi:multidrug resistance protein